MKVRYKASGSKELSSFVVGQESLHLLVVGQVVQQVSTLGPLQVSVALVAVQVTMSHGVILEATVSEASNDEEPLLRRLLCLELELLDTTLVLQLGFDSAHLEAKVSGWNLGQAHVSRS